MNGLPDPNPQHRDTLSDAVDSFNALLVTLRGLEQRDPGITSAIDQAQAAVRDFLDVLGVDVIDVAQARAASACFLCQTLFKKTTNGPLVAALSLARYL